MMTADCVSWIGDILGSEGSAVLCVDSILF